MKQNRTNIAFATAAVSLGAALPGCTYVTISPPPQPEPLPMPIKQEAPPEPPAKPTISPEYDKARGRGIFEMGRVLKSRYATADMTESAGRLV